MFRSVKKMNFATASVAFRLVTVVAALAGPCLFSELHADEADEVETSSPYSQDADPSWLESFRSSVTPRSRGLARFVSRPDSRKSDTSKLISQSSDEAEVPQTAVPDAPFSEPADPAEPLDTLGPIDAVSPRSIDSELPDNIADAPITDHIQSRPPMTAEQVFSEGTVRSDMFWQVLPNGLLYKTYLAGEKEPRMQFLRLYDRVSKRYVDEAVLGGRVGIVRFGTKGADDPQGFQLDLDGAVFARVLPEEESAMLEGSDYRVGLYGTWRRDRLSYRFGYYHISSHVGDEYLIANPAFIRINYVRDSALAGLSYETSLSTRIYGEVGYAFGHEGGAKPLEFQFGGEYAPVAQNVAMGAPFIAANRHLREDFDFDGGFNVVAGWGWQGPQTGRRIRLGVNYYTGPSLQYEFFDRHEELLGGGIWLDF